MYYINWAHAWLAWANRLYARKLGRSYDNIRPWVTSSANYYHNLKEKAIIHGLVCVYSGDTVSHNLTSYTWVPAAAYVSACTDGLCIDLRAFNLIV